MAKKANIAKKVSKIASLFRVTVPVSNRQKRAQEDENKRFILAWDNLLDTIEEEEKKNTKGGTEL